MTAANGVSDVLCLAATPIFAVMALLSALGGSPMDHLCSSNTWTWLSGMTPMYAMMSAFHSPAWLKLIGGTERRRRTA